MTQKVRDAKPVHFSKRHITLASLTLADLYWFGPNLITQIEWCLSPSASSYSKCVEPRNLTPARSTTMATASWKRRICELENVFLPLTSHFSDKCKQLLQSVLHVGIVHSECHSYPDLHRKNNIITVLRR